MKSRTLILYVVLVDALALSGVASVPWDGLRDHAGTLLLLAILAALVGSRPVMLPRLRTEVTASDAFGLCALAAFGSAAGALVGLASVVGATLGEVRRPTAIRLAFNLGAVPLSMLVASAVHAALGGSAEGALARGALPLAASGIAYFTVNTGLVAGAIALDRNQKFWSGWGRSLVWTAVASITGITVAAILLVVLDRVGPAALLLGVPPAWILTVFFRTNKERIEEQHGRIETVESQNAELEQKVAERTRSLQEVLANLEATNRQLRESNERLVEAGRVKSEFLANVSHELRTPLNAILGFSELLADPAHGDLTGAQREYLADVRDSGEHLLHLINNILDLTKIEAGRLEVNRKSTDVAEGVRSAAAMLRTQAAAKEIALRASCAAEGAWARLDPGMFREILANLLSNAVKFTPPGGRVDLEARVEGDDLILEVRDTGIGIRPEDREKIFEAFYQVDGSYSRSYQGTGLGLALVVRMMALHDGAVTVESEPGRGSTFRCRFPASVELAVPAPQAAPPASERRAPPPARPAPGGAGGAGNRTILLVEDNPLNRKLARNALRSRGHRVIEAVTGEEALALVDSQHPDLVLMDLQLPGMDGLEATRRIKSDPANAELPVVALTAHVEAVDEARAREAGCAGYITKPIRLTRFPAQVEAHLRSEEVPA